MISLPLFFQEDIPVGPTEVFYLNEETSRHMVQVLRLVNGNHIQLTNGKGLLVEAEVVDAHKKKCGVQMVSSRQFEQPLRRVIIAISLIKNNNRFEWFLEKATEIGIAEIIPLICRRTEKSHFKRDRMGGILISAMLQSQQLWLPELGEPISFDTLIEKKAVSKKYIAHCLKEDHKNKIFSNDSNESCMILIGPEGDFTQEEVESAMTKGFESVSLGNTRLRTETAGVVAAALLTH